MLGNFACFLSSVDYYFFFFKKNLSGLPSECHTVGIQVRSDVLSGLICVETVAKVIRRRQKLPLAGKN